MPFEPLRNENSTLRVLNAYLLGRLDFGDLVALQRSLVYEVSGNRAHGMLVLCEHPYGITIGREGSAAHAHFDPEDLNTRGWPVRWTNRGGGCLLHAPGQIVAYPIVALDRLAVNVQEYLDCLHDIVRGVLSKIGIAAERRSNASGIWVQDRRIAHIGVAVTGWVAYFGLTLNVDPNLNYFRQIDCDGEPRPMTSIARERREKARPATVRQLLLAAFAEQFGFDRISLFHHHPALNTKARTHAVVTPLG